MAPIIVQANQPEGGFYKGGAKIAEFRSDQPCKPNQPEDWVASTTCCNGSAGIGYSKLPDGSLLKDAVADDPQGWLGSEHVSKYGPDTKILLKLLDAGQRLPVHAHPHDKWASEHLGEKHGKAEAWYVLTPGSMWLGLKEDVPENELLELVESERAPELLDRMHKFDVKPHQTLYVPPGTLHAIGEGVMVVEVQEPQDLSILCEWVGFDIDGKEKGHLGLGFKKALTAVDRKGKTDDEANSLVTTADPSSDSVCAKASHEYFHLERVKVDGSVTTRRGFAIVVVLEGKASLKTKISNPLSLKRDQPSSFLIRMVI